MLPSQILEGIQVDWLRRPRGSASNQGQASEQFIRWEHAAIGAASIERLVTCSKRALALPADDAILGPLEATDPALAASRRRQHGRRTKVDRYSKVLVPVCLLFDCDGAASGKALWLDFNHGEVKPVRDIGQSFRREPTASDNATGANNSSGRQVAVVVADAVLGPLEPINPMLALAYDQDMLEFELSREEPAASEHATGADNSGGRIVAVAVADNAILGPLEPIDHMLALSYHQEMLEFELEHEEPAAGEGAVGGIDSVGGMSTSSDLRLMLTTYSSDFSPRIGFTRFLVVLLYLFLAISSLRP